jgi:hypothetical protein
MRAALLFLLALAPQAHAQVVECPKFYPWEDTVLAEVPYRHQGKGVVAKGRLRGATAYTGEFNGQAELQGMRKDVKGGFDVQYGFAPGELKWLVCTYGGGDIAWWEQLDSKVTSCKLSVRKAGTDPLDVRMTCK